MDTIDLTLPADVASDIERLASENGITFEQQADTLLRWGLGNFPRHQSDRAAKGRIAAMTPSGARRTDGASLLREDRNR